MLLSPLIALPFQAITCTYPRVAAGADYLEVAVDVGSSYVARNILGVVQSYAKRLTIDLARGQ